MKKKKVLSILIATCLILTTTPAIGFADTVDNSIGSVETVNFIDMPNDWSTESLKNAITNGLITGYDTEGGKAIRPSDNITRAETATMINRLFGATEEEVLLGVTDLPDASWFKSEMAKAVKMGTFKSDRTMRPNDKITREEAFTVLARALKVECTDNHIALSKFSDKEGISVWAKDSICGLIESKYVQGSGGKLNPISNITRAEFAKTMDRVVRQYIKAAGTYTEVVTNGNVMVSTPGVILKNVTINGDLIIGDGVGSGDVIVENVKVTGRVLVRGGGINSIRIIGNSEIASMVVSKVDGNIRISVEDVAKVETISINDGKEDILVEGKITNLEIQTAGVPVRVRKADIKNVMLSVADAKVIIEKDARVEALGVSEEAEKAKVDVTGIVTTLKIKAPKSNIVITGVVNTVEVTKTADGSSLDIGKSAKINTLHNNAKLETKGEGKALSITGTGMINNKPITSSNGGDKSSSGGGGGGDVTTDTTSPVVTAGKANRISDTSATVKFTTNESGQYYYAIVEKGAVAPAINTSGVGGDCTTAETTINIVLESGAKDVYIVVKDAAGNISAAIKISVLANQEAPTGLVGVAPTSSANNDGKITGVDNTMEYKLSTETIYKAITGNEIIGLVAGAYTVRFAEKEGCAAGVVAEIEVPEYKGIRYGIVQGFSKGNGLQSIEIKLLTADGKMRVYAIAEHLDVEAIKGQIVAYEVGNKNIIEAMDATDAAISADAGLNIRSTTVLSLNNIYYPISDDVIVFTYDGITPSNQSASYDISTMNNLEFNELVMSSASIYLDDEGYVVALLVPESLAKISKPTGLVGIAPTSSANNDGKITGVDNTMEYKLSTEMIYKGITGNEVTGLAAGIYTVRFAAKEECAAGAAVEIKVPKYVGSKYGIVQGFVKGNGIESAKIKLLTADGITVVHTIEEHLDVEAIKGQIVAYEVGNKNIIKAIDATNAAISADAGLNIKSRKILSINNTDYVISDDVIVFTYDGITPSDQRVSYDINTINNLEFNERVMSSTSIYLDDEGYVVALLVPESLAKISKPTGLVGIAPTSSANNDGKITGVDNTMEYKLSTEMIYNGIAGNEVTGLAAGIYTVRFAAKEECAAGAAVEIEVPEYVETKYGVVRGFSKGKGLQGTQIKLLTADGITVVYTIAAHLDVEAIKGQIVAYGVSSKNIIEAIDATNAAISADAGLNIKSRKILSINNTDYVISDDVIVFTYDGITPSDQSASYDINTISNILYGIISAPASIYLDNQGEVIALLIPTPRLNNDN